MRNQSRGTLPAPPVISPQLGAKCQTSTASARSVTGVSDEMVKPGGGICHALGDFLILNLGPCKRVRASLTFDQVSGYGLIGNEGDRTWLD